MKSSRRRFLKFVGLSAAGVVGSTGVTRTVRAVSEHEPPASQGKRWAMVIDLRKFSKDDALNDKIISACNTAQHPRFLGRPQERGQVDLDRGFRNRLPLAGVSFHP